MTIAWTRLRGKAQDVQQVSDSSIVKQGRLIVAVTGSASKH
jgi:hypothetical protein